MKLINYKIILIIFFQVRRAFCKSSISLS